MKNEKMVKRKGREFRVLLHFNWHFQQWSEDWRLSIVSKLSLYAVLCTFYQNTKVVSQFSILAIIKRVWPKLCSRLFFFFFTSIPFLYYHWLCVILFVEWERILHLTRVFFFFTIKLIFLFYFIFFFLYIIIKHVFVSYHD